MQIVLIKYKKTDYNSDAKLIEWCFLISINKNLNVTRLLLDGGALTAWSAVHWGWGVTGSLSHLHFHNKDTNKDHMR